MAKLGNEKLKEAILRLAEGDANRSATSRLADIIDEVEQAVKKGVRLQAILDELKAAGLTFTANSLDSARRRIKSRSTRSPKRVQKVTKHQEKTTAAPTVTAVVSKETGGITPVANKFVYDPNTPIDEVL